MFRSFSFDNFSFDKKVRSRTVKYRFEVELLLLSMDDQRVLNVNVGVLGHVDSGKTSLVGTLSTHLSTAALDKHPQSAERGITLDLGFSSFQMELPEHLKSMPYDVLQVTLVDCPGHASLIRTIIGGSQIIDLMFLVIDATKGIQTQTAECLVVGEISPTKDMIIVLNKIDLIPIATRSQQIEKLKKKIRATLKNSKFSESSMVALSAKPQGEDETSSGIEGLILELKNKIRGIERPLSNSPFLFSVDHCFPIRGQGTVLTGTVLQGSVSTNAMIEIPELNIQRKVKSMQIFHRPVAKASQGDRVGICVTQFDSKLLERGLVAAPGTISRISGGLAKVKRVKFFKGKIGGKTKFHVTIGHTTVMAETFFFKENKNLEDLGNSLEKNFNFSKEYKYLEELMEEESSSQDSQENNSPESTKWALLKFDSPVTCAPNSLFIASRLDTDIYSNSCRLAFHGNLISQIDPKDKADLEKLRVFKLKSRKGLVDRVVDSHTLIGKNMFKKESDISKFVGLKVITSNGAVGVIHSPFGKSGKFKVTFKEDMKKAGCSEKHGENELTINFKRYVFDRIKEMIQT